MDGVLVDSERYWPDYHRDYVFERATAGEAPDPAEFDGLGVTDTYAALAERDALRVDEERFVELNEEAAQRIYGEEVALLDGFESLAGALRGAGVPIGVVSSSYRRWIDIVLERFDLADRFDVVVSGEALDGPSKPEPHVYERAAAELAVEPQTCLAVEDSRHGVAAARAAGMDAVAYRDEAAERIDAATATVTDPEELADWVTEWARREKVRARDTVDGR